MLFAGVLLLVDAPALGPLMGGMVFGSVILLVLSPFSAHLYGSRRDDEDKR
jgi:hypothetical protein